MNVYTIGVSVQKPIVDGVELDVVWEGSFNSDSNGGRPNSTSQHSSISGDARDGLVEADVLDDPTARVLAAITGDSGNLNLAEADNPWADQSILKSASSNVVGKIGAIVDFDGNTSNRKGPCSID